MGVAEGSWVSRGLRAREASGMFHTSHPVPETLVRTLVGAGTVWMDSVLALSRLLLRVRSRTTSGEASGGTGASGSSGWRRPQDLAGRAERCRVESGQGDCPQDEGRSDRAFMLGKA